MPSHRHWTAPDKIWALRVEDGRPAGEPWLVGETRGKGVDGLAMDELRGRVPAAEVEALIEELAGEIRRSFDYFKAQTREPLIHRVILSGGTAKLRKLDVFLTNEFGIPLLPHALDHFIYGW